jgi:hypothetical protein
MASNWGSIDWAITWSGVTSLLTVGLLVATCIYAWLTRKLVIASEKQLSELTRPRLLVTVTAKDGGRWLALKIENTGLSTATNLLLSIDRPVFQDHTGKNIQELPFFSGKNLTLSPGIATSYVLGTSRMWLDNNTDRTRHPSQFSISASYNFSDREFEDSFYLDIESQFNKSLIEIDYNEKYYREFPRTLKQSFKDVVVALNKIQKILTEKSDQ